MTRIPDIGVGDFVKVTTEDGETFTGLIIGRGSPCGGTTWIVLAAGDRRRNAYAACDKIERTASL